MPVLFGLRGTLMNDLIKLVFAQIPRFISTFVDLQVGPKRFVRRKNIYGDQPLTEAITFLAITFVLGLILKTPFIPEGVNFWQYVATNGLADLMEVVLFAAALRFSWKFVGGHAPFGRFLITFCYYYGVFLVLSSVFHLFALGVAKACDPEL